ncbi:MAG: hypothetical protein KF730_04190 [Sphingomonas sp.]|uniref:hypothetical protein n=1 Tax=Sphingomonas sp. TaxID=28214 RepID=UPI0025EE136F|nr:hypothetical protein [Sphingomonas sp.]MBX3563759.1 hypothetical protein [Sphingomonas sp.]
MQLLPMNVPAEIHRWVNKDAADVIVARGPLVIMAHGLMALDPAERGSCWIATAAGDLSPGDAEEALRSWSRRH